MKKLEQNIHTLINLNIINVNQTGEKKYKWSPAEYESERKQHEKLLIAIRDCLAQKLGAYHRYEAQYEVAADLDGDSKTLNLSLILKYYKTDLEINKFIQESENLASVFLDSIKTISAARVTSLNDLKIQECEQRTTTIENDTAYLPKDLKSTICGFLRKSNGSKEATYSINHKKILIALPKTNNEIIESEEMSEFTGRIYGVDEKEKTVRITSIDKKKSEKYPYQSGLEEDLLTAQINKSLVKLKILKNYCISIGNKTEKPGTIVGVGSPDQRRFEFSI